MEKAQEFLQFLIVLDLYQDSIRRSSPRLPQRYRHVAEYFRYETRRSDESVERGDIA